MKISQNHQPHPMHKYHRFCLTYKKLNLVSTHLLQVQKVYSIGTARASAICRHQLSRIHIRTSHTSNPPAQLLGNAYHRSNPPNFLLCYHLQICMLYLLHLYHTQPLPTGLARFPPLLSITAQTPRRNCSLLPVRKLFRRDIISGNGRRLRLHPQSHRSGPGSICHPKSATHLSPLPPPVSVPSPPSRRTRRINLRKRRALRVHVPSTNVQRRANGASENVLNVFLGNSFWAVPFSSLFSHIGLLECIYL